MSLVQMLLYILFQIKPLNFLKVAHYTRTMVTGLVVLINS